jgi:DNA repair protein RecN (Recombination protein N)
MIDLIKIRNLALVEETEIEFGSGFNVITGETGAGKTVLMKALGLLLGERADKSIIRNGAKKCEISALINLEEKILEALTPILSDLGISLDSSTLIIRRIITQSSSRNFINDSVVTLQTLKKLGDLLIDIHGPYDHQSLLHNSHQLDILDAYGSLQNNKKSVNEAWNNYQKVLDELVEVKRDLPSSIEAEHLKTIVSDIENAELTEDEDTQITQKHKIMSNAREILEALNSSVSVLNESENSVSSLLGSIRRDLSSLSKLEIKQLDRFVEECDHIMDTVRELSLDMETYSSGVDIDENSFLRIENRMALIQSLKRKYGPTLNDVKNTLIESSQKLDRLDNFEYIMEELKLAKEKAFNDYLKKAEVLSEKRKKTAKNLNLEIKKVLKSLGFLKADFDISFFVAEASSKGIDSIEFMFSANPGETLHPLKKVASSGEISRLMLALKTVVTNADAIPILVFDEIDVNIGGETASVVGQKLRSLSSSHQLLCISHLPQVAACSDQHYKVEKYIENERTVSQIKLLDNDGRIEELTRMLGGGQAAKTHAVELLNSAVKHT